MWCVHCAAELAPMAKVGGLADVLQGLSKQLSHQGHRVDILLPKYATLDCDAFDSFGLQTEDFPVLYQGQWHANALWKGRFNGVNVFLFEETGGTSFFTRDAIYGQHDDPQRFLYFSRLAYEWIVRQTSPPDIVHLHDWQVCGVAALLKQQSIDTKVILTIHNLSYQGHCQFSSLDEVGIARSPAFVDPRSSNSCNLLRSGIVFADRVTTVSPTYAKEILTPERAEGLQETLKEYAHKLCGILNGIDMEYWNPGTDPLLPETYSSQDLENKRRVKTALRLRAGLVDTHRPLVGCIARLVPQKGLELIKQAIEQVVSLKGQFVLLGSTTLFGVEAEFLAIEQQYRHHPHVRLFLKQDEALAHWVYGGADQLIVPSLFEPCGLVQLIALRYGTIPIVHATGGLADTILDQTEQINGEQTANGYRFSIPTPEHQYRALERAISDWYMRPALWNQLVHRSLTQDVSWRRPGHQYECLYQDLLTDEK